MKKVFGISLAVMIVSGAPASTAWDFSIPFFDSHKNVILIIPDGCSVAMWATVRAVTVGTKGELNIDRLPVQSRCRTYSADCMITDSAAAATAYACGVKTRNGVLGMNADTVHGDSLSGAAVPSILELAERNGYATGIVTTTFVQHATPAAFYTHQADRDWYNRISLDLSGACIEVILGGGRQYMIPAGTRDEEGGKSSRADGRNLIEELRGEGYVYVHDRTGFDAVDPAKTYRLLGLFNPGNMDYEFDRARDKKDEPGLWEMTEKAIRILSKNKKGFFLMVEAGRIDDAAHDNDPVHFLWDGIACEKTVGVAMNFALKDKNTLVIVVPDHGTGGPHLIGVHGAADSTVKSGPPSGFVRYRLDGNGFPVDDSGYPVAIGWASSPYFLGTPAGSGGSHTGEDVGVHAMGPHARELCRLIDNTDVYRVMKRYLGL